MPSPPPHSPWDMPANGCFGGGGSEIANAAAAAAPLPIVDCVLAPGLLHALIGQLFVDNPCRHETAVRTLLALPPDVLCALVASVRTSASHNVLARLTQVARLTKDTSLAEDTARMIRTIQRASAGSGGGGGAAADSSSSGAADVTRWLNTTPQLFESWLVK